MDRRSFMRFFGAAAAVAPSVKSVTTLPDHQAEKFSGNRSLSLDRSALGLPLNVMDIRDGVLFDRVRFKPGTRLPLVIRMFQTPIGQICPYTNVIKTYRHTNMQMAGGLPAPTEFLAQRVLFAVHPSALQADIDAVSAACAWEFQLLQKILLSGPMLLNGPARAGLRDIVGPNGKTRDPLPDEVLATAQHNPLAGGVFLPSLAYFIFQVSSEESDITLKHASEGGRGIDLLIALQGAWARGVQ